MEKLLKNLTHQYYKIDNDKYNINSNHSTNLTKLLDNFNKKIRHIQHKEIESGKINIINEIEKLNKNSLSIPIPEETSLRERIVLSNTNNTNYLPKFLIKKFIKHGLTDYLKLGVMKEKQSFLTSIC